MPELPSAGLTPASTFYFLERAAEAIGELLTFDTEAKLQAERALERIAEVKEMLAEDGIYGKHLGVGWNEWRYFWKPWNHPHEWNITDPTEYTASGPEPGVFKGRNYLVS